MSVVPTVADPPVTVHIYVPFENEYSENVTVLLLQLTSGGELSVTPGVNVI